VVRHATVDRDRGATPRACPLEVLEALVRGAREPRGMGFPLAELLEHLGQLARAGDLAAVAIRADGEHGAVVDLRFADGWVTRLEARKE